MNDEYREGMQELGEAGMVFYKFFSLFGVRKDGSVRFGPNIVEEDVVEEQSIVFRNYLKEQREWIRQLGKKADIKELQRRMWWVVEKMMEFGFFTNAEQKTVMIWLDICLTRLSECASTTS